MTEQRVARVEAIKRQLDAMAGDIDADETGQLQIDWRGRDVTVKRVEITRFTVDRATEEGRDA